MVRKFGKNKWGFAQNSGPRVCYIIHIITVPLLYSLLRLTRDKLDSHAYVYHKAKFLQRMTLTCLT